MRLGVTDHLDCAHLLREHPKCGQLHGHTYRVELTVEGEAKSGLLLDFADLKAQLRGVLARYDHRHWNDFMDYPTAYWVYCLKPSWLLPPRRNRIINRN